MALSLQQVRERIKNPVNKAAILDADRHEQRIKLHAKPVDRKEKATAYFNEFLSWVSEDIALPADKMKAFKGLCQFPLSTNALTSSIFLEHEKVFSAQDSYFDVNLMDDSLKASFKGYLEKKAFREVFRKKAFDIYCKKPETLFVIDLPSIQQGLRPEPYFYTVAISNVIDIEIEKTIEGDKIGLVIFKDGKGRVLAIDDAFYRVLEKPENGEEYLLIIESPHALGYAPCTFLPQTALYDEEDNSPVVRKTILSNVLADLDWLQFWKVAERMVNTYGPFPIWTVPRTDCDFTDTAGNQCQNGVVARTNSRGEASHYNCPVCAKNNMIGPGTVYEKPIPKTKDQPELGEAVHITTPDVVNLEYIAKRTDYLEWEIYANTVGSMDETVTKEAVNEKQVQVSVEGKKNILLSIKKDFEACEKFIIDTYGRLMYQKYYVNATVNYGETFMIYSAAEVVEQFQTYKKAGLPGFMIARKKQLLLQTENRNNPYEQRRAEILNLLEPWPDLSLTETVSYQLSTTFAEKFALKLDFAKFVSKFEMVNGDIVQWGTLLSLPEKINRITQILTDYAKAEFSVHSTASNTNAAKA